MNCQIVADPNNKHITLMGVRPTNEHWRAASGQVIRRMWFLSADELAHAVARIDLSRYAPSVAERRETDRDANQHSL